MSAFERLVEGIKVIVFTIAALGIFYVYTIILFSL
jgi:hypothetical protein